MYHIYNNDSREKDVYVMLFDYILFTLTGTMMTCFVTLMCTEKERLKIEEKAL